MVSFKKPLLGRARLLRVKLRKPTCVYSILPFIRILICSVYQTFSSAHDALSNIFHISFTPFPLPYCSVGLHRLDAGLPL